MKPSACNARPSRRRRRRNACAPRCAAMDGYMREWRQIWHGRSPLVLRPGSTDEVSRILAIANETRTAIVPQSGNTGLVRRPDPDATAGDEVLLSLDRMTHILDVDAADNTITVEAGAILKSVQDAADSGGPAVSAEPRVRRLLPHRRQSFDQCRRPQRDRLWQYARPLPRPRGGAGRWPRVERPQAPAQGQYGL